MLLQRWRDSIERIQRQVWHLVHLDDVFWQIQAILRENRVEQIGIFLDWMVDCFADAVTVRLRRLGDRRKGTLSLGRLLTEMENNATAIRREHFVADTDPQLRTLLSEGFDALGGIGHDHMPRGVIAGRRVLLERALDQIEAYANENVTHVAVEPEPHKLTFDDLRLAMARAYGVFKWCHHVLTGGVQAQAVPAIQDPWLKAFNVAWLPRGQHVPDYRSLDDLIEELHLDRPETGEASAAGPP